MERKTYPKPDDFVPEETFQKGHKKAGQPRCQGWSRTAGRQCMNSPLKGKRVCAIHGGKGGRPPIHGKYTHAARLVDDIERAVAHPDLLSMTFELATNSARIGQLFRQMDELDLTSVTADILEEVGNIRSALLKHATHSALAALNRLEKACTPAQVEARIWDKVLQHMEVSRKLSDSERKWLHEQQLLLTIREVVGLLRTYQEIALRFIPNSKDRKAFYDELEEVTRSTPVLLQ